MPLLRRIGVRILCGRICRVLNGLHTERILPLCRVLTGRNWRAYLCPRLPNNHNIL